MNLLTLPELLKINYFLTWVIDQLIFRIIWSKVKKQSIYIDTRKYTFFYEYRKMWFAGFYIYSLIATHGLKRFITLQPFNESKQYQVIFLDWNLS